MKFFRSVDLNRNLCPRDLYDVARRLSRKPEDPGSINLHVESRPGDEENAKLVEQIVAMCKERGLDKVRGACSYHVSPVYEQSDLDAAPLLQLATQRRTFKGINSNQRDERGRIVLPAAEAKATIKIASIFPESWIVVSSATRRILESGGLIGMEFEDVAIKGHSIHLAPEPFWELRSTVTLPKMLNSLEVTTDPEFPRYVINDPLVEPHYRESEIRALGAFDIAYTSENFRPGKPLFVVSERFYHHCVTHKIPLEVLPVRIDPACKGVSPIIFA